LPMSLWPARWMKIVRHVSNIHLRAETPRHRG
jgi:hypothetical protein